MGILMKHTICVAVSILASWAALCGCSDGKNTTTGPIGNAELSLDLDDGSEINQVVWQIFHDNGFSREGAINLSRPAATISTTINGIPADTGYEMTLAATSTTEMSCNGLAVFNVVAGETTQVSMTLQCHPSSNAGSLTMQATANICPIIDFLSISPLTQGLGSAIDLIAEGTDSNDDALVYRWTSTPSGNSFENPTGAVTRFNCDTGGTYELTLTISDGAPDAPETCSVSRRVPVTCLYSGIFDELHAGSIMLGRPTDHSVAISVVADINHLTPENLFDVYFEYGTVRTELTSRTETVSPFDAEPLVVTIDGLQPNTAYFYRMRYRRRGDNGNSEWLMTKVDAFHTQRPPGAPFVFTVQADSHLDHDQVGCDEWLYWETVLNILKDDSDFHFDLGDTFNNKLGTPFIDGVIPGDMDTIYPQYLSQLRYLGTVGRSAPVFLVVGNHENEEGWNKDDTAVLGDSVPFMNQNARKRYFLNPVPNDFYAGVADPWDDIIGDHLRDAFYAFHWGDALFVVIDPFWYTEVLPFTGGYGEANDETVIGDRWSWTLGTVQYQWLKETLETSPATFKFVFSHHLTGGGSGTTRGYGRGGAQVAHLYEWGGYNEAGTWEFTEKRPEIDGWASPIHQLLAANDVTILFHGHDHLFVKEELDGIVYQECPRPCDNNPNDDFGLATDYSIAIENGDAQTNSGHLRVSVSPDQVTVDYVRSPSGEITYSYTIPASH